MVSPRLGTALRATLTALLLLPAVVTAALLPDLFHASFEELSRGLQQRDFTSRDLVKAYLARIDEVNVRGPGLHAVVTTSPMALQEAEELDALRAQGVSR
jgi:amidase